MFFLLLPTNISSTKSTKLLNELKIYQWKSKDTNSIYVCDEKTFKNLDFFYDFGAFFCENLAIFPDIPKIERYCLWLFMKLNFMRSGRNQPMVVRRRSARLAHSLCYFAISQSPRIFKPASVHVRENHVVCIIPGRALPPPHQLRSPAIIRLPSLRSMFSARLYLVQNHFYRFLWYTRTRNT